MNNRHIFVLFAVVPCLLLAGCVSAPLPTSVSTPASPTTPIPIVASPGLFRDIAPLAGIDFTESNGARGDFLIPETTPGGCAVFDYDNDGFLDVFLVQSGPVPGNKGSRPPCALYHNNGNDTFTDVTVAMGLAFDQGYAHAVAIGDYDNDGFEDVLITAYDGCYLFHNAEGKRFVDVTARAGVGETGKQRWATSAAFGDYDGDGHLDLIVLHYTSWTRETDKVCKDSKGKKAYCSPEVYGTESPTLYHNRGNGVFEDVTRSAGLTEVKGRGLAVVWTDFDQNGHEDLYIANDLQPNQLLRNLGNGKFREEGLATGVAYGPDGATLSGMGIAAADYENTGWESYAVTNFSGQPDTLYRAMGNGLFEDATYPSGIGQVSLPFLAFGIEFIDYDRDGWRDMVIGNGHINPDVAESTVNTTYAEPKLLFRNLGSGRFARQTTDIGDLAQSHVTRGLAIGDVDNDGRVDILTNNHNEKAQLFHNESSDQNHWVSFRLEGVKSNRDALGTLVWVTTGGKRYFAECRLGSSYASVSDKRLFFGLGAATTIDSLTVRWPHGQIQTFRKSALTVDRFYYLREGSVPLLDTYIKPARKSP